MEHLTADQMVFLEEEEVEVAVPAIAEEREATGHVQYRSWCRHCLAGRGICQQHRSRPEEAKAGDELAIIACNYTWMTKDGKEDGKARHILVVKDSKTLSIVATFVDAKGPTPYAVKFFANLLHHPIYRCAVMMSDGEHAEGASRS